MDILKLLSILDGLGKNGEFIHWLLNSLKETIGPGEGSRDWWQVLEDWGSLISFVYECFTFHKEGSNCLEVLLVKLKEGDVLLLKLILDDWSVQETLE